MNEIQNDDITKVFCETLNKKGNNLANYVGKLGLIGSAVSSLYSAVANPIYYNTTEDKIIAVGINMAVIAGSGLVMYATTQAFRPIYQWVLFDNHVKEKTLEYIAQNK